MPRREFPTPTALPTQSVEGRDKDLLGNEIVPRRGAVGIAELATAQHGVVAGWQLGISTRQISSWVDAGHLHPVHRDVFAVGHRAISQRGRWMAAVLACGPQAVLSHRSAAALLGLVHADRGWPDVTVPRGGGRGHERLVVHRIATVERATHAGIPCTTVSRTLVDLAATETTRILERAVDEAAVQQVLDVRAIAAVISGIARPRGVRTLRAILALHTPRSTRTKSDLEELFLAICRRAGLPDPICNEPIAVPDGRFPDVDFQWPGFRVAAEADGDRYHTTEAKRRRDRANDRALQLAGWLVLQFPERDLSERPDAVVRDLRAAFMRRGTR